MCGIVGYVSDKKAHSLAPALASIHHRGPDAQDSQTGKLDSGQHFGLGHTRLSIIDLDPRSNQPFLSEDQRYSLVFNGELYNFKELRSILEKERGIEFQTTGDTEVLFQWLMAYGTDRLSELDGMFAFAFMDKQEEKLLLVRDPLGIKPVYWSLKDGELIFASEIKALWTFEGSAPEPDRSLFAEYLLNGFIYEPETGFKGVQKVFPGSWLELDTAQMKVQTTSYWKGTEYAQNRAQDLSKLVEQSIDEHTVADVPVGLFFSGGIDSTVILTAVNDQVKSMTVQSEESEYVESGMSSDHEYAMRIGQILDRPIESIPLSEDIDSDEAFLQAIETTARENEELIYDFTYMSSKLLSFKARERKRIVVLSGMGADELFGGYPRYQLVRYKKFFQMLAPLINLSLGKVPWFSKKIGRFNTFLEERDFGLAYTSLVGVFSPDEVRALLGEGGGVDRFRKKIGKLLEHVGGESRLKQAMYLDRFGFLSHNFLVADKSSMQASIEMRVPLVTRKLAEAVWQLPDKRLIQGKKRKLPLVRILEPHLPDSIIHRKKAGFNPPLDGYIRKLGAEKLNAHFSKGKLGTAVDMRWVHQWIEEHFSGKKNHTYRLVQLLHLNAWLGLNSGEVGKS